MSGAPSTLFLQGSVWRTDAVEQVGPCKPDSALTLLTETLTGKASNGSYLVSQGILNAYHSQLVVGCTAAGKVTVSVKGQLPGKDEIAALFFLSLPSAC